MHKGSILEAAQGIIAIELVKDWLDKEAPFPTKLESILGLAWQPQNLLRCCKVRFYQLSFLGQLLSFSK